MGTKAVILCGGQGTRIRDANELLPEADAADRRQADRLAHHEGLRRHGVNEFVLCLGYKGWLIKEFFLNYRPMTTDVTVDARRARRRGRLPRAATTRRTGGSRSPRPARRRMTGGRVCGRSAATSRATSRSCSPTATASPTSTSASCSPSTAATAGSRTVTAVRPPGRFGEMRLDGRPGRASSTRSRRRREGFINGGFFVFDGRRIWDVPRHRPARRARARAAAAAGARRASCVAYQHTGFWQPMDTLREYKLLNDAVGDRPGAVEDVGPGHAMSAPTRRRAAQRRTRASACSSPATPASRAAG